MRLSRMACGLLAAVVMLVTIFVVMEIETRLFGSPIRRSVFVWAAIVGGSLFWVADRFDLLSTPYSDPTLGLHSKLPDVTHTTTTRGPE